MVHPLFNTLKKISICHLHAYHCIFSYASSNVVADKSVINNHSIASVAVGGLSSTHKIAVISIGL